MASFLTGTTGLLGGGACPFSTDIQSLTGFFSYPLYRKAMP